MPPSSPKKFIVLLNEKTFEQRHEYEFQSFLGPDYHVKVVPIEDKHVHFIEVPATDYSPRIHTIGGSTGGGMGGGGGGTTLPTLGGGGGYHSAMSVTRAV